MIIKGGAVGAVGWWGKHLMRDDTNDRAEVKEIHGLLSQDVPSALREMQAIAAQSRCQGDFMYSVNINPRDNERLTDEQWREAVDTLEKNMGLEGHQRVVVEHEKEGRVHRHVVWNRVDALTLRVADIGFNYYTHERTSRELEGRFGLAHTPSLHGEHRPDGRPERAPELWEQRAEEKSGISRADLKAELTELWRSTDSGQAFAAALCDRGYILARGDSRAFCVIDQAGDVHSLARRLDGVKAAEVAARFEGIDRDSLPSVAEAKEILSSQSRDAGAERETANRPSARAEPAQTAWREARDEQVAARSESIDPVGAGIGVLNAATGGVEKLADFVLDFLGGGSQPKPQIPQNQADQIIAQRKAAAALERIRDSMEKGEDLSPADVRNLTPTHLENIRLKGDDYMRQLIERMQADDRTRQQDYGRERER